MINIPNTTTELNVYCDQTLTVADGWCFSKGKTDPLIFARTGPSTKKASVK